MKFSELLSKPVLSLAEGEVVGDIQNCLLTPGRNRLLAFSLGDAFVSACDARIGENAILIRSRSALSSVPPEPAANSLLHLELYTAEGHFCGSIEDLVFDDHNRLTHFVTDEGEFSRSLLLSAGENAVVVCSSPAEYKRERRKIAPPKPKSSSEVGKVSSTFSYLIGRKVQEDVFNQRGERIVRKGACVSLHTLRVCRDYGKLLALARSCKS